VRAAFAAVLAVVGLLAACGLPKDGSPREIAADKIPFGLLGPSTTAPSNVQVEGGTIVHLYFIDGSQLRSVSRSVARRDVKLVLEQLVKGLTDSDPLGIRTAIPKDTTVVDVQPEGNNVVVTLSAQILAVASTEQRNAFAQLVYTTTDLGVDGVRFRVVDASGNNPQDVQPPTDEGTHAGPLTRSDYVQEAPS